MPIRISPKGKGRSFRNTRRENELEELGRVDAEKAHTSKGKRNLRDEKHRIRKELAKGGQAKKPMDPQWKQQPLRKRGKQQPKRGVGPKSKRWTSKTHGGGPDAGNIGKMKDALSKLGKGILGKKVRPSPEDLQRIREKMPKKYPPKRVMTPLRKGGSAKGPNRPRPTGPHMWVRGDKRKKYNIGGRANLLEEMGRIDARRHPDRADRAEKRRVIRELNKGYNSGGVVLKGKKVGCQIK